eukprot:gene934-1049_t
MEREQGAEFVFQCLRILLDEPGRNEPGREGPIVIDLDASPPSTEETIGNMKSLLETRLGSNYRCLIHLDEVCRMISDDFGYHASSRTFSTGAIETLAMVRQVTVVVTGVSIRPLSWGGSSSVGRHLLPLPAIDMDEILDHSTSLKVHYPNLTPMQKELLVVLKFRLGMVIRKMGAIALIHGKHNNEETHFFVKDWKNLGDIRDVEGSIRFRLRICANVFDNPEDFTGSDHAAEYLLGVPTGKIEEWKNDIHNIVAISDKLITYNLEALMEFKDEQIFEYVEGVSLFCTLLNSVHPYFKLIYPLEASYVWTLSCFAEVNGFIQFFDASPRFVIKCISLSYVGSDSEEVLTGGLKNGAMHYPSMYGKKVETVHPMFDLYFKSDDSQLVFLSITGSGPLRTEKKREELSNWIERQGRNFDHCSGGVYGVVLAPQDTSAESVYDGEKRMMVVRGKDARALLGGLNQVYWWMVKEGEDDRVGYVEQGEVADNQASAIME